MTFKEIFDGLKSLMELCVSVVWFAIAVKVLFFIFELADKVKQWKP